MDTDPTSPECAQIIHYNLDPEASFDEIEKAKHDRRIVNQAETRVDAYNIHPFSLTPEHAFKLYYETFVIIHRNPTPCWKQTANMVGLILRMR